MDLDDVEEGDEGDDKDEDEEEVEEDVDEEKEVPRALEMAAGDALEPSVSRANWNIST